MHDVRAYSASEFGKKKRVVSSVGHTPYPKGTVPLMSPNPARAMPAARNPWISTAPDGCQLSSVSGSNLHHFPADLQITAIYLCSCV